MVYRGFRSLSPAGLLIEEVAIAPDRRLVKARCRAAAALARRLMLPVSRETLPRVVRVHAPRDRSPLNVIGIDDWAWKRGQRYGSIICDLERRRIVDLLPDREPVTIEGWLARHPEVRVISRDRGGGYG